MAPWSLPSMALPEGTAFCLFSPGLPFPSSHGVYLFGLMRFPRSWPGPHPIHAQAIPPPYRSL